MLAAAARIATRVDVPVTVDAEAGYRMEPTDLVVRLKEMRAAGCNLEDTNHASGELRDLSEQADWLRAVRAAASAEGYGLVINARIDVFLAAFVSGADEQRQAELVGEALRRAHYYVAAGADCVFPILLWQPDALESFISQAPGPVNVVKLPQAPSHSELAELGVARISYGILTHRDTIEHFGRLLESLPADPADEHGKQP
jgi:2-methylisocitrate lyase-like PEP mutase family enzyme